MFPFLSSLKAQEKITLKDAITIALNKNVDIVKDQNNIGTYESAVKSAYGNLIPSLSFGGGWGWQRINSNGTNQLNYFGSEEYIPPSQTDSRSYSLSLGGNVTLFDGLSNYASIEESKNNLEAAKLDLQKLKEDVVLQTVNLFVTIISDNELVKFQEEDLKYNQSLLDRIKEMYDLKMSTLADVYSQQVQTSNSELTLLQDSNNYEKAKIALFNYLSIDVAVNDSFDVEQKTEIDSSFYDAGLDTLFQVALNNRKDYQSEKFKLESSQNQLTSARGDLFPSLSGNYGVSTSAEQLGDLFDRKVYSIGLSLSFPIFSHWNTEYSIQSAKIQIENTNEDMQALERQIRSDVKSAMLDLQTSKKQLQVSNEALKSAKEGLSIKRESYNLGATTFVDLQQTYRDYVNAENNIVTAEHNYLVKQYELLNSLGKLDLGE